MTKEPPRFLVIGAGSRGSAYGRAVTTSTNGVIHAVAEPHAFKRAEFGRTYIWGDGPPSEGQCFSDWRAWLEWEVARRASTSPSLSTDANTTTTTTSEPNPEKEKDKAVKGVTGVFICTLDSTHAEILHAIAPLNLHILCEKPLALSLHDCLSVFRALKPGPTGQQRGVFSIGHVLRYSPHNVLLRRLVREEKVVGEVVSMEHCEPVGWWHFSHSYVRGNWRRETSLSSSSSSSLEGRVGEGVGKGVGTGKGGDGSLLTKSCHDIDFVMWMLASPVYSPTSVSTSQTNREEYHPPRTITSSGSLTQFRRARKPPQAGSTKNCLSCPIERTCMYSAVRIYRDNHLRTGDRSWPVNIVCPDIEDVALPLSVAEERLLQTLEEDYTADTPDEVVKARPWYGRCVYEADNDVCDDQVVTITWDDQSSSPSAPDPHSIAQRDGEGEGGGLAKTALFHMIAPTEKQCERRGRIYGTTGEMTYDSRTITIYDFASKTTRVIDVPKAPPEEERAHGGGDYGLTRAFVAAVEAVEQDGMEVEVAQRRFVGCTLEEAVRSHAVVFAAEEARREEKVVRWGDWWERALGTVS